VLGKASVAENLIFRAVPRPEFLGRARKTMFNVDPRSQTEAW
jgi:hypothetical protein